MSARRGWCPSLHEPMPTGDGLLVRVKPRGGVMSARAVRVLSGASVSFGNGMLELTRRGAVQARGLSEATAPLFAAEMVAAGLGGPGRGEERRRNVVVSPLAGVDPDVHHSTRALAASIEVALEEAGDLELLAAKFAVAVDGGGVLPVGEVGADIGLRLRPGRADIVLAGGSVVASVPIERVVVTVLSLARAASGSRMRSLVEARGIAAVLAMAGLEQQAAFVPAPGRAAVGEIGYAGGVAFGAGLPFGSAAASEWVRLADLSARFGDGGLRLTPWRTVLIAGVQEADPLRTKIEALGLIVDPEDARLRVDACPGRPACASASVATRALASRLRPAAGVSVHVSGCDKGCAHPGPAAITLVGREGGYDLVRNGRASDAPALRALSEAEMMAL